MWFCWFVAAILIVNIVSANQWIYFEATGFSYYIKYGEPRLNFTGANEHCMSMGSELASIHSEDENRFLYEHLREVIIARRKSMSHMILFGLRRQKGRSASWYYTDNTKVDYYKWAKNEPDNSFGVENCTLLVGPSPKVEFTDGEWMDITCDHLFLSHICKKRASSKLLTGQTVAETSRSIEEDLDNTEDVEPIIVKSLIVQRETGRAAIPEANTTFKIIAAVSVLAIALMMILVISLMKIVCKRKEYLRPPMGPIPQFPPNSYTTDPCRTPLALRQQHCGSNGDDYERVMDRPQVPEGSEYSCAYYTRPIPSPNALLVNQSYTTRCTNGSRKVDSFIQIREPTPEPIIAEYQG